MRREACDVRIVGLRLVKEGKAGRRAVEDVGCGVYVEENRGSPLY